MKGDEDEDEKYSWYMDEWWSFKGKSEGAYRNKE